MIESNVICPSCKQNSLSLRYQTKWICNECHEVYPCKSGIPRLYLEDSIGEADQVLRDQVYKYMAWFYNFWNPLAMLPVRPIKTSLRQWGFYFLLVFALAFLFYNAVEVLAFRGVGSITILDIVGIILLVAVLFVLFKQPRFGYLLLLAIPVKIILLLRKFVPEKSISTVHEEFLHGFANSDRKLKMLDIACGSGQALYRRGYLDLNADFAAVDLAEGMIVQARRLMVKANAPVDFILADATNLPFESETFDICTNYGAFNGFEDPEAALREMARVTKKGGKILILDEKEYPSATWLEHLYFKNVFAYHNTLVGSPADLPPVEDLEDIELSQVYEFVYVYTARKKRCWM